MGVESWERNGTSGISRSSNDVGIKRPNYCHEARRVGVSRQSVSVWARALVEDKQAWRRKPLGAPAALGIAERKRLCELLLQGAVANGFATELWILQRIAEVIEREFGVRYCKVNVWLLLKALGFSCQRPTGRASQRDEKAILDWKQKCWPMLKKARRQGRTIVFIDETGLSERPVRTRSWAPKGQTPLLRYSYNWTHLTVIAALGQRNFYFRFVQGAIQKKQVVEFLRHLLKQVGRKLLIIWDRLPGHRSAIVTNDLKSTKGKIVMEYLPGYAPGLNPSEYIWAYAKQHELANLCRDTIGEVKAFAARRFKSMQRRAALIASFWKQAGLAI